MQTIQDFAGSTDMWSTPVGGQLDRFHCIYIQNRKGYKGTYSYNWPVKGKARFGISNIKNLTTKTKYVQCIQSKTSLNLRQFKMEISYADTVS